MAKVTMLAERPGLDGGIGAAERIEMTLRLTPEGRIDVRPESDPWPIAWTGRDGEARRGELVRIGSGWALRRDQGDDDPLWRLQADVLRPGETVTLCEPDGARAEYRVVAVEQD
jgi:hypothetical protein